MAHSLTWIAVRRKAPEAVQRDLGVRGTGKYEDCAVSPLAGATLLSNWYVVVAKGDKLGTDEILTSVSADCELIACKVDEKARQSAASMWENSAMMWSVTHDAAAGPSNLDELGALPPLFEIIRDRLAARQEAAGDNKDADYFFEIPIELAQELTGFRHDKPSHDFGKNAFEVLVSTTEAGAKTAEKKSWWKVW